MIPEIEQVAGGYRVAFRLNPQAQRAQCFSPVFPTLEELHAAHPDLAPAQPEVVAMRQRSRRPPRAVAGPVPAQPEAPAEPISGILPAAVAEPIPPNGEVSEV